MALIELNLEKPALKRTETVEHERDSGAALSERTSELEHEAEDEPETTLESEEIDDGSKRGGRRIGRRVAMLGAMASAVMLVRKMRSRRNGTETDTVEEDWQAPESE